MKKIMALVLALSLLLAGCSSAGSTESAVSANSESDNTTAAESEKAEDQAENPVLRLGAR